MLYEGNAEIITQDISERLKIGKRFPGFVLSSACSIAPKTSTENVQLLSSLVKEYGFYQLTGKSATISTNKMPD